MLLSVMLDYKLVEALAKVIEGGGFQRAAQSLGLTQSAVSQRVKLLEDGCGRILITRGSPPRPTTAGQALLKHYRQVRLLEDALEDAADGGPATLSIGLNTDSLASWFMEAARPLLRAGVLLDLRVDDQEQTHRFLRDGEVVGCVSTVAVASKGCRVLPLGAIVYRMLATPDFRRRWFPDGFSREAVARAPAVLYNAKDRLHHDHCERVLGAEPGDFPTHFIPRPEQLFQLIAEGHGYGMLPDWQSAALRGDGRLVDLGPGEPHAVPLYWHCWNLESGPLELLTRRLAELAPLPYGA